LNQGTSKRILIPDSHPDTVGGGKNTRFTGSLSLL
jgi:hypothetical protein